MEKNKQLLISVRCIKKYYPNDIGTAELLKSMILNNNIKAAKKVQEDKRFDVKIPTRRKISYYPVSKIEQVIERQESSLITEAKTLSRSRLLDVIDKIKKGL